MSILRQLFTREIATSEFEALQLCELIGPVITTGSASDLVIDFRNVILALPQGGIVSGCLDWWLKVHTNEIANSECYYLPDSVVGPLRHNMETLRDVACEHPPAQWQQTRRRFEKKRENLMPHAWGVLDLNFHGQSKLPRERDAWAWLLDSFAETISALREGQPGPEIVLDEEGYESELASAGIDPNSRRWNEMVRRGRDLADTLADTRQDAMVVASGRMSGELEAMPQDLPTAVSAALGNTADYLFAVFSSAEAPDGAAVARKINTECVDLSATELNRMALRLEDWLLGFEAGPPPALSVLDRPVSRLAALRDSIRTMRNAGIDSDDVELNLLEGQFDAAEQASNDREDTQQHALEISKVRADAAAMRQRFERAGVEPATALVTLEVHLSAAGSPSAGIPEMRQLLRNAADEFDRELALKRREFAPGDAGGAHHPGRTARSCLRRSAFGRRRRVDLRRTPGRSPKPPRGSPLTSPHPDPRGPRSCHRCLGRRHPTRPHRSRRTPGPPRRNREGRDHPWPDG